MRKAYLVLIFLMAAFMAACSGTSGTPSTTPSTALLKVRDNPLPGVLSAEVTISSVSLTTAYGDVTIMTTPETVELSSLAGQSEALELETISPGTYSAIKLNVTAARVTYLDATNTVWLRGRTMMKVKASLRQTAPIFWAT